jgi:tetratricopeptide (TPR) repeat protein
MPEDENRLAMGEADRKLLNDIGECIVIDGHIEGSFVYDLINLKEKYPKVREAYNYLSVVYSSQGKKELATNLMHETYDKLPDYFFGKVNKAFHYINQGEHEKVKEIFPSFDLNEILPKREKFHASEVVSFMAVLGRYYLREQNVEVARHCLNIAASLDYHQAGVTVLAEELESLEKNFLKVVQETLEEEFGKEKMAEIFKPKESTINQILDT